VSRRVDRLARDMAGQAARLRIPASEPPAPFIGTMLDAMDATGLVGESWAAWLTFWKAVFALPVRRTGRRSARVDPGGLCPDHRRGVRGARPLAPGLPSGGVLPTGTKGREAARLGIPYRAHKVA
jgi:hypothetical protein